ncbi:MAG TPA: FAD-binding domain-containing protein [Methylibium sp.]|uniref:FAD-binding domain-containing protein n=1 Tax=Methylibium sp. TaxID=2067992 RepID=UPI002DC028FC|nr:FAD-binding domain-containing protein [Methylibium sp.]HEU4460844.1 FAD-binding domain-containing protein [Methylibium sp.]
MTPPIALDGAAAQARLAAVRPADYAATRNHLDGAVTGLSPWLTHGVLDTRETLADLQRRHALAPQHKLVFELGWREFFRHAWRHDGDAILGSLHAGLLPDASYAREMPADIRRGATGLAVIDTAVRTLYATGALHNHARMWLASYVVHLRKVHWRAGADWLYAHLLDGDLASNHLSWQWVAGTGSSKPYFFNAENVRRFAPPAWQVDRTALDTPYEAIDAMARDAGFVLAPDPAAPGIDEPASTGMPPADAGFAAPDAAVLSGRAVWLVHPWCLRDPPAALLPVAILEADFHRRWPWSERRWRAVTERMRALTPHRWIGEAGELRAALLQAACVHGRADPHLGRLAIDLGLSEPPAIWPEPGRRLRSFSAWWTAVRDRTPAATGS